MKSTKIFVPYHRKSIDHHDDKLKQIEKSLKLTETRMDEYHIEPILSSTSLPESPHHYGRPSEVKRPFILSPKTRFKGTFVKDTMPLEEEDKDRAIATWIYREETWVDLT